LEKFAQATKPERWETIIYYYFLIFLLTQWRIFATLATSFPEDAGGLIALSGGYVKERGLRVFDASGNKKGFCLNF